MVNSVCFNKNFFILVAIGVISIIIFQYTLIKKNNYIKCEPCKLQNNYHNKNLDKL